MGIGYPGNQFKLGAPSVLLIRIEGVGDAVARLTKKKGRNQTGYRLHIIY